MYLSDDDIRLKLPELDISCENPKFTFDEGVQIQPCSIDIRLDCIFWKTKKSTKYIDLRKSKLLEVSPRRYWQMTTLNEGECIVLRPGEFILGRTYEVFTIPKDCAGKLEGRSSMARLGLASQIGADFINPGWRGRMPIQLVNYSRTPIKVFPFIPICQLMLIKLSGVPLRLYGEKGLESKYTSDDGGPSYWWRDKRIQELQKNLEEKNISIKIQDEVLKELSDKDSDVINRFDKFYQALKPDKIENADSVLDKFTKSERNKFRLEELFIRGIQTVFIILTGWTVKFATSDDPASTSYIIVYILNAIAAVFFAYTFFYDRKEFYKKRTGK